MTPLETSEVLAYMQAAWPSFTRWDEMTITVWSDLLHGYTQAQVAAAVKELALNNSAFAPSPGQISAHIDGRNEDGWRDTWPAVTKLVVSGALNRQLEPDMFPDDRSYRATASIRLPLRTATADHGQRLYADAWRSVGPNGAAAAIEQPTGPPRPPGSTCTGDTDCPGMCMGQQLVFDGDDYQPCMGDAA